MLIRRSFAASLALFIVIATPLAYAQDPTAPVTKGGRGGGQGGPGGGGPGGGGGFGGPGGGFGGGPGGGFGGGPGGGGPGGRNTGPANDSVERLIQVEAVQDDLKIDDKTKAKIKTIGEEAVKERTKRRDIITKQALAMAAQATAQQNALLAEQLAEAGIVVDPKTLNANNNNGGGGRGGRGGPGGGNQQMERQMMNLAMDALEAQVDAKMLKLLSAAQKTRLKQIQLQQEGTRAFTTPNQEVVSKLGLTEEQLAEINTANREIQGTQRQAMQELFASIVPQDNNGGGNGGGGGGRGGRPNMQNLDEATRAKFDTAMQNMQTQNTNTTMAAIGKILTKGQKVAYDKMIGAPFDVSKLRPARPGAPGTPATPAAGTETAAAKGATPPADAKAATKPAAKAKGGVAGSRGDDN